MSEQTHNERGRRAKIEAVKRFIEGIGRKDMSGVPFAPNVLLRSPLTHPAATASSASEFVAFLSVLFPKLPPSLETRIHWHVVEGDHVITRWEWEIGPPKTVLTILDHFEIVDGQITLVEPFFDPRPILPFTGGTS
jgi:hypothetical protein